VNIEEKWPVLGRHERAAEWLTIWTNLGRAPRTVHAYARGLAEYLLVCERDGVDPLTANRSQVALFVRELATRPHRRGGNVLALDSGVGLSNATLQQRLVSVRLFYDFLIEEGVRDSNPVGRGRYTPGSVPSLRLNLRPTGRATERAATGVSGRVESRPERRPGGGPRRVRDPSTAPLR